MRDISTHWVLKAPLCDRAFFSEVIKPQADKQALYTQGETRNYGPEIWKDTNF